MADVEDALVYAVTLRDVMERLVEDGKIEMDTAVSLSPDSQRPGSRFRLSTRRAMKGGHVLFGEWDCSSCGKPFYMELAITKDGSICDSLGGVLYSADVVLCDACSPI